MDISTELTKNTRYIPTRILKGGSYLYTQTYFEASDYGIMALDPDTLEVLATFRYNDDRISDFSVYSDSRIAVRSDSKLAVLSFSVDPITGPSFTELCSVGIRSSINTGVACNNNHAFVSCGDKLISLDIATGKIVEEFNISDSYNARNIACNHEFLIVRKCRINLKSYKLAAYSISNGHFLNPSNPLDPENPRPKLEIDSPIFDMDLGRLSLDSSLKIIETGLYAHRLIDFSSRFFLIVEGELSPHYPALEFIKHGDYYITSPDTDLKVLSLSGTTFIEEYNAPVLTNRPSYKCPGFNTYEFFSTRDALGDGSGRNVSINTMTP